MDLRSLIRVLALCAGGIACCFAYAQEGVDHVIKFPVAHHHPTMTGTCWGYLYVSRDSVRYEVVAPRSSAGHAFTRSRADVVRASAAGFTERRGSNDYIVQFRGGEENHFAHVDVEQVERRQTSAFLYSHVRPIQPMELAFSDFDRAVGVARNAGLTILEVPRKAAMARTGAPPRWDSASIKSISPSGFYADPRLDFDVLDGATVDLGKGTLTLFGHRSSAPRSVPYLDYLAAAIESSNPTFSLEWTAQSRQVIDRAFNMKDEVLTNRLAGTMVNGRLTRRGEWWYHTLGVDVPEGSDQMTLWAAVLPAAGYPEAGKVMRAVREFKISIRDKTEERKIRFDDVPVPQTAHQYLVMKTSSLAAPQDQYLNTVAQYLNGAEVTPEVWNRARETVFSWMLQGIAIAYKMDRDRYLNYYQGLKRSGVEWNMAFARAIEMSDDDTVEVQKSAFHALVGRLDFIHFPPEVMAEVLGISPVVVPVFEGLPQRSLLAKVAFDADVFGKNLMFMPEIKPKVPGYRTYFEWRQTVGRPPADLGHTWFAPEGFQLIESADGGTLRFGKTPVRIHMEKYVRGAGSSSRMSVADPLLAQYADELTALYEPLAGHFPVLLDLRESMKAMAIARWLKQKGIKLAFPAEGRGSWNPPAQIPGVIHMEIATKPGPVGEVMSASGGVDLRVDRNWELLKQRIEEQPGPPPAHGVIIGFNPASGIIASTPSALPAGPGATPVASAAVASTLSLPAASRAPGGGVNAAGAAAAATSAGFTATPSSPGTSIFTCYRIDPAQSGCLELRNTSTRRFRLYVIGLPGVQCAADPDSYCVIPLAVGSYQFQLVTDDETGASREIRGAVNLPSTGARVTLTGGP